MGGARVEVGALGEARVATVWLDRPERLNALDAGMWSDLRQAFLSLREDPAVRAVLVRSTCPRAFCTGLDLGAQMAPGPGGLRGVVQELQGVFDQIEDHPVPVVAVLHGYVLGGGLELALACDLRVCADDAELGLTEARRGIVPAAGGTWRLARHVGLGRAKWMTLTGERIDAARALAWGLVQEVVPRAGVDEAVERTIELLVRCAPLSQRWIKDLVGRSLSRDRAAGAEAEADAVMALAGTRDLVEGFRAFAEKRTPRWKGK